MAPQLRDHDRYDILGEHGRGGLGRVSRAHDRELGRDIAIKELIARGHLSEVRFLREALITARLEHPGIVPVYEAGRWADGTPFYAMKLVSGRPLRELIAERKTVDERIGLLHHAIAVADAIAYAHGRGIIHRDLKPSNVIVGDFGETVVIDWGLAKDLTATEEPAIGGGPFREHHDEGLTSAGTVLGTPAYMAPEQARGEPVDQRADVFAIGAMLWELCSLQKLPPSFSGQRRHLLRKAGIDPDLITIIEKAADPDPARRYPDAGALAADLKAFKAGARIAARRYSLWALLIHWTRRHRTLALSLSATLTLAAIAAGLYIRNISAERDRVDAALKDTATARNDLLLEHAELLLRSDPTAALDAITGYQGSDLARAKRVTAEARGRGVARVITAHSDTIHLLAGLPDGSILSIGEDRRIVLSHDAHVTTLALDAAVPIVAEYSNTTGLLAYASMNSGTILLDPKTRRVIQLSKTPVYALRFSDDGTRIATYGQDSAVTVWSTDRQPLLLWHRVFPHAGPMAFSGQDRVVVPTSTGFVLASLRGAPDVVLSRASASFDISAERLAVGDEKGIVSIYDVSNLRLVGSTSACRERVGDLRIVPRRAALIFVCQEGGAGVVDLAALSVREHFPTQGEAFGINTSDDGRFAIILSASNIAYVHDLQSQLTHRYEGQAHLSCAAAPTATNFRILTGDINGVVRSWEVPDSAAYVAMRSDASVPRAIFSPDGRMIASGDAAGTVSILKLSDGTRRTNRGHTSRIEGMTFTDDGLLLTLGFDSRVFAWQMDDLRPIRVFEEHHSRVEDAALIEHGHRIISVGDDGRLLSWSPNGGQSNVLFTTKLPLVAVEALTNDNTAVVADASGSVWHVRNRDAFRQVRSPDGDLVTLLRASPDGRLVAVGTEHGNVTIYDSTSWNTVKKLQMNGTVRQVAFMRDNSHIAVASERQSVRLVSLTSRATPRWQEAHMDAREVTFSTDDQLLAIVCSDGALWFYSFIDDAWEFSQDHFALTSFGRFSPNSRDFVSSDDSGAVVIRDVAATFRDHPRTAQFILSH